MIFVATEFRELFAGFLQNIGYNPFEEKK